MKMKQLYLLLIYLLFKTIHDLSPNQLRVKPIMLLTSLDDAFSVFFFK